MLAKNNILNTKKIKKIPELIFWFDTTPKAELGPFQRVADIWENQVYFFCLDHLRTERTSNGWSEEKINNAKVYYFSDLQNDDAFFESFLKKHPNAIHVFNGFRSNTKKYFQIYIKSVKKPQVAIWSERPGTYGPFYKKVVRKLFLPIVFKKYYRQYNQYIDLLLPLGQKGVNQFMQYGWSSKKVYPFMYNPNIEINKRSSLKKNTGKVNFLYIGRFSKSTKGVDVLRKATNKLSTDKYTLSLVGGYGEHKQVMLRWINSNENLNFLGSWGFDSVVQNITDYDIVIVPSRFDGWNLVVNKALLAGVGVIVSDEAVSDELINVSGAGKIFSSGDYWELSKIMSSIIENPDMINEWKILARNYAPKITPNIIGDYLYDLLHYTFIDQNKNKPICPWL